MEEKKLTGAESLELISRMIETTKKRMEVGSGNKFLLYGYSAVALSVAVFLLVRFTGDPRWNFAWFLMFIPGMVDAAASRERRPAVVTYMDGVLSGMWWIVGALFFLTVIVLCAMAFVYGVADFSLMLPLGLLYACFGTSVTGIVIKEPWLVCMPLVGFVAAVGMLVSYALLVDDCRLYWGLWFGLSFLVMMVVPGHIINRKAKRACSGN